MSDIKLEKGAPEGARIHKDKIEPVFASPHIKMGSRPNNQPVLQPKPVGYNPIRPTMIGQQILPQLRPGQPMAQNQIMMTAAGVPVNIPQPRTSSKVFQQPSRVLQQPPRMIQAQQPPRMIQAQQPPRMRMLVQGQVAQPGLPKLVTGVPVYQNNAPQFAHGQIRLQQSPATVANLLKQNAISSPVSMPMTTRMPVQAQSRMTLMPQGQGQFQATQMISAGQGMVPRPMMYRPMTGLQQVPTFNYAGLQVQSVPVPAHTSQNLPIQPKTSGTTTSQSTSSPSQVLTAITQIPRPQFLSMTNSTATSTAQFLTTPSGPSPVSPLVPISPNLFQVGQTLGQQHLYSSQMTPTMLTFGNQATGTTILNTPRLVAAPAVSSQQSTVLYRTNHLGTSGGAVLMMPSTTDLTAETPTDLTTRHSPVPSPVVPDTGPSVDEALSQHTTESFHENILNLRQKKDLGLKPGETESSPSPPLNSSEGNSEKALSDLMAVERYDNDTNNSADTNEGMNSSHSQRPFMPSSTTNVDPDQMIMYNNKTNRSMAFDDDDDDHEFVWEEYLQTIGASAVPPTAFKHVEYSLQSGFVKGMKLEVPNKGDSSTYWVASVIMTCGPLLRLRFDGYENDNCADFWCDLSTSEVHPIGWCAQNSHNLQPPEEIKDKFSDWKVYLMTSLTGARTAPSYLLDKGVGSTPIDQLKPGARLELQEKLEPMNVWLVLVLQNVGGRLYLRLEGAASAASDFWMFFLDHRLHPIGWANQNGCQYKPPKEVEVDHFAEEWDKILSEALKQADGITLPLDIFKDQVELKPHKFEVGMKLEAVNPAGPNLVSPATVIKVINDKYFVIEIDDLRSEEKRESIAICCHSEYLGIFPMSWCQCKGIRLASPPGWKCQDFLWGDYLQTCMAKSAPEKLFHSGTDDHEFERGMKLEAANPENPNQICAATITKIVGPLLWIHLDNMRDVPSHVLDIDSHDLFPVGWCESNGYQLRPPRKACLSKARQRRFSSMSDNLNGEAYRSVTYSHVKSGNELASWCPTIYFNHRCFSGPYLSKGRISELPKSVGPGPMGLVLKEVLTLLINVAYKSCRVLKELQQEGPPNPCMQQHVLKAKYKGKAYHAVVEVCRLESQLDEFCRNVCIKIECCPYLFSPLFVEDSCPENCQQLTKTKYNYNYGKKKKKPVGRPPTNGTLKMENGVVVPRVPGKRGRKKKKFHLFQKKHRRVGMEGASDIMQKAREARYKKLEQKKRLEAEEWDDGSMTPSKKRKYTHHIPPPSDIQTRGAKLPKYSFERKTHKKILLSHTSPPLKAKHKLKPATVQESLSSQGGGVLMRRQESLQVETNPLHWSVDDVVIFIKTTDCSHLARIIKEQEIDGQALLLMSLATMQEHLDLKLGPAVKLCHQIEQLKVAFYESYA